MDEAQEHDWKAIATELARGVHFALANMKPPSPTAMVFNETTNVAKTHIDYLSDILENYPGIKVDREMLECYSLPKNQQKKALKELEAKRESAKQGGGDE